MQSFCDNRLPFAIAWAWLGPWLNKQSSGQKKARIAEAQGDALSQRGLHANASDLAWPDDNMFLHQLCMLGRAGLRQTGIVVILLLLPCCGQAATVLHIKC